MSLGGTDARLWRQRGIPAFVHGPFPRGMAQADDATRMPIMEIASRELTALAPGDSVDKAVKLMRSHALRRFPVVDSGKPVGVITMGDLVMELDPQSALADISSADANR